MARNKFLLVVFFLSNFTLEAEVDTSRVLTEKMFLGIVLENHPLAKQTELLLDFGESNVRKARGGFDPKLFIDYKDKEFKSTNYYDLARASLKFPTWYGLEFKTGWEYSYGNYYNPENKTPIDGLGYAGVSIELGQGLFIDKRRATLLKAKQYQSMNLNDRNAAFNDLLKEAIENYWEWSAAFKKQELIADVLEQNEEGVQAIRGLFLLGELSVLDTLEAFTQLVAVQTELFEAKAFFQQKTFELNNFLWDQDGAPLIIDGFYPDLIEVKVLSQEFEENYEDATVRILSHPILKSYEAKYRVLEIERKLMAEKVKPKFNVQYNLLTTDYQLAPNEYSSNNYKWGVKFSLPLLLRKERGALQLSKLKLAQQNLKIRLKQQELITKLNTYKVKNVALKMQNKLYKDAVDGYQFLYNQEIRKLEAGESSLFKLTSRQAKMFRANMKLIDLNLKLIKSKISYIHSIGVLYLSYPL